MASLRHRRLLYLWLALLLASQGPSFAQQGAEATGTQLPASDSTDIGTIKRFPVDGDALSIAWSPDGRLATSSYYFTHITVWDSETGKVLQQLRRGVAFGGSLAFTPNGREILTSTAQQKTQDEQDATVSVWDIDTATVSRNVAGPNPSKGVNFNKADAFALDPKGPFLAVIVHDSEQVVVIYETSRWSMVRTIAVTQDGALSLAFSPDGKLL